MNKEKLILGYWAMQGLGQVPRYLLEYLEIPYENKMYTNKDDWTKDKQSLGLDFPNLPYVIDGDSNLTESIAIIRYIAFKGKSSSLLGENEKDQTTVSMMLGVCMDIAKAAYNLKVATKNKNEDGKKVEIAKLELKVGSLAKYLREKNWMLGYLTVADFLVSHVLEIVMWADEEFLNKWDNLKGLKERFYEIEKIKTFRESERCPKDVLFPV